MIHLVPNANGIDFPISKLQIALYESLYNTWGDSGMTSDNFDVFGRTYRNNDRDGFTPQWYKGNKDYSTDMFFNDKKAAVIWFGVNDPTNISYDKYTYNVSLYVMVNLDKVRPTAERQRMDERVVQDVCKLLSNNWFGFNVVALYRDIDNVLAKYNGFKAKSASVDTNLQPKCCFRIDLSILLNIIDYDCQDLVIRPQYFYAMTAPITAVIKDVPNTSLTQTLWNGTKIQVEYPSGSTLTIPHLIGRDVFPDLLYNWTPQQIPYDSITGTFTFGFQEGDIVRIMYNENS